MVKRLFKIKDKEITKDEFYDDIFKKNLPKECRKKAAKSKK